MTQLPHMHRGCLDSIGFGGLLSHRDMILPFMTITLEASLFSSPADSFTASHKI